MNQKRKREKDTEREREIGREGGDVEPAPTNWPETQQVKQTNPNRESVSAFSQPLVDFPYLSMVIQIYIARTEKLQAFYHIIFNKVSHRWLIPVRTINCL